MFSFPVLFFYWYCAIGEHRIRHFSTLRAKKRSCAPHHIFPSRRRACRLEACRSRRIHGPGVRTRSARARAELHVRRRIGGSIASITLTSGARDQHVPLEREKTSRRKKQKAFVKVEPTSNDESCTQNEIERRTRGEQKTKGALKTLLYCERRISFHSSFWELVDLRSFACRKWINKRRKRAGIRTR